MKYVVSVTLLALLFTGTKFFEARVIERPIIGKPHTFAAHSRNLSAERRAVKVKKIMAEFSKKQQNERPFIGETTFIY